MQLNQPFGLIAQAQSKLRETNPSIDLEVYIEFVSVLKNNPGYNGLGNFLLALNGKTAYEAVIKYLPNQTCLFKNASLTSWDVRLFQPQTHPG